MLSCVCWSRYGAAAFGRRSPNAPNRPPTSSPKPQCACSRFANKKLPHHTGVGARPLGGGGTLATSTQRRPTCCPSPFLGTWTSATSASEWSGRADAEVEHRSPKTRPRPGPRKVLGSGLNQNGSSTKPAVSSQNSKESCGFHGMKSIS